jgi:merozoite surface antigen 2c
MPKFMGSIVAAVALAAGLGLSQAAAGADGAFSSEIIDDTDIEEIRTWLQTPVVQISVEAQNGRTGEVAQDQIDKLDKQWRAERKEQVQPMVAAVLSNPLSNYLTQIQAASGGLYTEIFVMDSKGLNVGQSAITSDYWQGDEGKFQKTFPKGADAVFVDEAELNEGTKTWRSQINLTVVDTSKKPIGAITVEVNLTELARRKGL